MHAVLFEVGFAYCNVMVLVSENLENIGCGLWVGLGCTSPFLLSDPAYACAMATTVQQYIRLSDDV